MSYKVIAQGVSENSTMTIISKEVTDNVVTITTENPHMIVVGQEVVLSEDPTGYAVTNKQLTTNVATLTFSSPHRMKAGTSVTVSGVDAVFDGNYSVTAVTDTTISYNKSNANIASTASAGVATFLDPAFNGRFVVDSNPTTTTFTYWYLTEDVPYTISTNAVMSYSPWKNIYTCPASTSVVTSTIAVCNQSQSTAKYQLAVASTLDPERKEIFVWNDTIDPSSHTFFTLGLIVDENVKHLLFGCDAEGVSINIFGTEMT